MIPTCAGTYMVLGRVKHSQSLSATPVKPWVAIKAKGTVVCAHCTCMAGLGEACSHIAALLFMMEGNTQHKMRMACTSLPCYWLPPSFREVPYSQLADMDFVTPKKKQSEPCNLSSLSATASKPAVAEPTTLELYSVYTNIYLQLVNLFFYLLYLDTLTLIYHYMLMVLYLNP